MRDGASLSRAAPRVSVCLPVYNGANYVADAIRSVLCQSWTDLELVVQDNCSTDTTPAVLESFHDARISLERNATDVGLVENINRAIERSCGEYVHLLCHDDVLAPTCLEKQVRFLDAHPSVAAVFTWFEAIDAAGESNGPMFLDRLISQPDILSPSEAAVFLYGKGCSLHMSTAMVRRAALTPFDASFAGCLDWAKWVEISTHAHVAILREVLGSIRLHDASLTHRVKQVQAEETYRVLEMLEQRLPPDFPSARVRRRFYGTTALAYATRLVLQGRVGQARRTVNIIRNRDPLLPVAVALLLSSPAWLKRWWARRVNRRVPARQAA